MDSRATALLARLDEFVAFARKRTGDPQLAADAVQESFLKALSHLDQLQDDERLDAWFYRILRHVIIDLQRARRSGPASLATQEEPVAAQEDQRTACACVAALVGDLPEPYANALRRVDLDGQSMEAAAAAEGISMANLKVRRHRARDELRALVHTTCKMCAAHGCIDCTCGTPGHRH
jgi:RNA polymerase sigma factor (sigma-70 family)